MKRMVLKLKLAWSQIQCEISWEAVVLDVELDPQRLGPQQLFVEVDLVQEETVPFLVGGILSVGCHEKLGAASGYMPGMRCA